MTEKLAYPLLTQWPVSERSGGLEQGCTIDCGGAELPHLAATQVLGHRSAGWWECDLRDDSLIWTVGVYGLFGLPHGAALSRGEILGLYAEDSRTKLERLRAWAIRNACGFALDTDIKPAAGIARRSMRILACPVLENGRVRRLQGLKILI